MKRRSPWKIYLWFNVFLFIFVLFFEFLPQQETTWFTLIGYLCWVFGLFGLFGFVYQKRMGIRLMWMVLFALESVFWVYGFSAGVYFQFKLSTAGTYPSTILTLGPFILFLPLIIAHYLYGFKSSSLWKKG